MNSEVMAGFLRNRNGHDFADPMGGSGAANSSESPEKWMYFDCLWVCVFAVSLPLVWSPLTIYTSNLPMFMASTTELSLWLSVGAIVGSLAVTSLLMFMPGWLRQWGVRFVFALGVLLWLQTNIFVWKMGVLDGSELKWSPGDIRGFVDAAVWFVLLPTIVFAAKWCRRYARSIAIIMIAIQLVSSAFALYGIRQQKEKPFTIDESTKFSFSSERNVVILVLDTFDTILFHEMIKSDPTLIDKFDGFTYYPNMLGGFGYTSLSIPLILTGKYYDDSRPFSEYVKEAFTGDSLPRILKKNGFRTEFYTGWDGFTHAGVYANPSILDNIIEGEVSPEKTVDDLKTLYKTAFLRSVPYLSKGPVYDSFVWIPTKARQDNVLPLFRESSSDHIQSVLHLFENQLSSPSDPAPQVLERDVFLKTLKAEASVSATQPVFKYYHLVGVHPPLTLNDTPVSYTEESVRQVAHILMNELVRTFLNRLKAMGVYDNSMIFIVGDHGRTCDVQLPEPFVKEHRRGRFVQFDAYMGRALPLFLFKPINSRGSMQTSMAPGTLADIAPTVFDALGLSGKTDGMSLLRLKEDTVRERRFFSTHGVHVGDPIPQRTEYRVNGFSWLDASWHETGFIYTEAGQKKAPVRDYSLGTTLTFGKYGNVSPFLSSGWDHDKESSEGYEVQNSYAKLRLPVERQNGDVTLLVQLKPPINATKPSAPQIRVFVNEQELALWNVDHVGEFQATIPKALTESGDLNICFDLVPDAGSSNLVPPAEVQQGSGLLFQALTVS